MFTSICILDHKSRVLNEKALVYVTSPEIYSIVEAVRSRGEVDQRETFPDTAGQPGMKTGRSCSLYKRISVLRVGGKFTFVLGKVTVSSIIWSR